MKTHLASHGSVLPLALSAAALLLAVACTPSASPPIPIVPAAPNEETEPIPPQSFSLPHEGRWELPTDHPTSRTPSTAGTLVVEGLGEFVFNPLEVATTRPDIFAQGHFSVFDVLAHLGNKGWFPLSYHYDARLDTHVIDELDGRMNWWYRTQSPGTWSEISTFRMDMTPYRDGMAIKLTPQPEEYMGRIYNSFADEMLRKSLNLGRVIIPEVRIGTVVHTNVPVSPHDFRNDVLQPGTMTALDVLLSLADQQKIDQLKLTWYSSLGDADTADSFWVEQINDGDGIYDREASAATGAWVFETGSREFSGFKGNQIHIPVDVRVIVSPEYMTWYWLGSAS